MTRKSLFITLFLALLAALAWSRPASATDPTVSVSGLVTADNYFTLYYGDADGGGLTQLASGSDWTQPAAVPYTSIPASDYLYLVAWNNPGKDNGNPQAWLGQFAIGGRQIFSTLAAWQYVYTSTPVSQTDLGSFLKSNVTDNKWTYAASVPSSNYVPGSAQTGNTSLYGASNIWSYYGPRNLSFDKQNAAWIWFDSFDSTQSKSAGNTASDNGFAVYRLAVGTTPPPPPTPPQPNLSGTIAGDNHFILLSGDQDGSGLTPLAQGDDWQKPVSFTATVGSGKYLYVVVWNDPGKDNGNPQAWLGQLTINGVTVNSSPSQWQYVYSTDKSPAYGGNLDNLAATISTANSRSQWGAPQGQDPSTPFSTSRVQDGSVTPYGHDNIWWMWGPHDWSFSSDSATPDWIWGDDFISSSVGEGYAIFRLALPVPLPASALLLLSGLLGLGLLGRRRPRG